MASRRSFLTGLMATGLVPRQTWAEVGNPAYLSAGMTRDGAYVLCGLGADGRLAFTRSLPARGHAAAAHPSRAEVVAFARRPGTFAIVLDCVSGLELARLVAPEGRHFYGHGAFSADGRLLFTTENEFDAARGIVGVWDAARAYRRIGEFPSGGTGPHDIKLMPDGATLVVANGGIETHPETGRAKLNLPSMRSRLSFLRLDGAVVDQVALDGAYRKNSIRHLAVTDEGVVAFAAQWQGDVTDAVPLLGTFKPGVDAAPQLARAPVFREAQAYLGSIAAHRSAIAVTSPRGGLVLEFDARSLALTEKQVIEDVCGIAPMSGGFICTSGTGRVLSGPVRRAETQHDMRWDNHLIAL
ncbi:MAG: DUF1513 domain-containing protein [Pseudomonadota bacterium]